MEIKYVVIMIIMIICTSLIAIYSHYYIEEISNNVTLVVEIGIGFIIAVCVYSISRKNEIEIAKKVTSLFNTVQKKENFRKQQKEEVEKMLLNIFTDMEIKIKLILEDTKVYKKSKDNSEKESYKNKIITGCQKITNLIEQNIGSPFIPFSEFFDVHETGKFKTLVNLSKTVPKFTDDEKMVNVDFCDMMDKMISKWIEEFSNKI